MAAFSTCVLTALLAGCTVGKHLRVESLDAISSANHHDIFTPLLQDLASSSHDVFVEDLFGKYLRLKYKATHPEGTSFLKLDGMKDDIESIHCLEDDSNTIELQLTSESIAESIYRPVSDFNLDDAAYFMTGSYQFLCRDKHTQRYSPLLRRITAVTMDPVSDDTVIFSTEYASYPEMFESLDLEFVSNAKLFHSANDTALRALEESDRSDSGVSGASDSMSRRRRLSWWSDLWDDICAGVNTVVEHVDSWIDTLSTFVDDLYEGVETAVEVVEGKKVVRNLTDNYFWSYNYDSSSGSAASTFYLDDADKVQCKNCFVWFDLEYTFKIRIEDRTMKYLYIVAEGDAQMHAEILLEAEWTKEWAINTPHVPIPYLGISVGGIEFGFTVYGGLGFGVKMEIDYVYMGYNVRGSIKRGIEYDADNNVQNYIGEHSFTHSKDGPQLEFNSMNITLYIKPTLYLALEYVGNVYFGVQAQVEFTFTKDADYDNTGDSTACAIDYVPTAKLLLFVGAKLQPLKLVTVWEKKASVEVAHATLTDLEGCITQSTLTTLETYLGTTSSRRRLAMSDGNGMGGDLWSNATWDGTHAFVDYTKAHSVDMHRQFDWGSMNSRWWGNMSSLPSICPENRTLADEDGNEYAVQMPEVGQLVIKVEGNDDGESLVGVLKTFVEVFYDDWGITTNVTCLSRMQLQKTTTMSEFKNMDNYEVSLLEWYCDLNLSMIGVEEGSALESAWIDMIALPETMNALVLDASFSAIMLFDDAWCQTFVLTKQHKYHVDLQHLLSAAFTSYGVEYSYPSQQWFGSYHCSHSSVISMSLLFESFFWLNGTGSAWLLGGDEEMLLQGEVDYEDFSARMWNEDGSLEFVGLVTLMQDGTVLYSGSVNAEDCTGFVFKGWLDTTPFESMNSGGNTLAPSTTEEGFKDLDEGAKDDKNELWKGMAIGFGAGLGVMLLFMVFGRLMGYSLAPKRRVSASYNLMREESAMVEVGQGRTAGNTAI